jgi:hypothetical protein
MRKSMLLPAIFAVLVSCSSDQATAPPIVDNTPHVGYFVTVNGSQTGDGSAANPWDLATAVAQPGIVHPGDTIWVHGGTYTGEVFSNLTGTPTAPIILRAFPGERAIIDGRLNVNGSYAYYWGLEVTFSDPNRVTVNPGSDPSGLPRERVTVFVTGPFNKIINMIVHDLGDGLFAGVTAEGTEIYGSLFYNNGWIAPDRGHGHNVYLQNQNATKVVADNVIFNSFNSGLHIYGSDATYIQNFDIHDNTIFDSGDPAASTFGPIFDIQQWGGAAGSFRNSVYRQNNLYHRDGRDIVAQFNAAGSLPGEDLEFSGNTVHGEVSFNEMKRYIITGNKITSGVNPLGGQNALLGLRLPAGVSYTAYSWNNNQYAAPPLSTQDPFYAFNGTGATYKFAAWQSATGFDGTSTYTNGQFTTPDIIVRANKYEAGRGFVTCWNWSGAAQLDVDLSTILKPGDQFEIRHVFNLFDAPLVSGTYNGGSVSIPQPTLTPPAPIGYAQPPQMPDNTFNVFIVQKR